MAQENRSTKSARKKAFLLYDIGKRPAEAAEMLGIQDTSAYRYYQQWKRLPPLFYQKYKMARTLWRKLGQADRRTFIRTLALKLGTSEEEVQAQMRKPWSLRGIVTGEWKNWPVERTKLGTADNLLAWLKLITCLGASQNARHLLELALNQSTKPEEIHFGRAEQ